MISAELLVALQQLKIYALERKSELLEGGKGLPVSEEPEEPREEDFIEGAAEVLPHLDDIMPLPAPQTALPPAPSVENAPVPAVHATLAYMVAAAAEDPQMDIAEVIARAQEENLKSSPAEPKAAPAAQETPAQGAPSAANIPPAADFKSAGAQPAADAPFKVSFRDRKRAYLEARKEWRVEKWRVENRDYRTRREILDKCYGYDDVVSYIDKIIKEERERDSAPAEPIL